MTKKLIYKGKIIQEPKNFVFRFETYITEKSKKEAIESLSFEPIIVTAKDFKFVGTKKPSKQDKELYEWSKKDFIDYCKGERKKIIIPTNRNRGTRN